MSSQQSNFKSHLLTLCNSFSNLKKNDAGNNDGDELNFQSRHDIVDKKIQHLVRYCTFCMVHGENMSRLHSFLI